ncbi:MAG: dihydrolipoamide acetyltransferase family protein [Gammaproteobacteria bacterium]
MTEANPNNLLRLPQFGLTMTEALIVEWAVSVGQTVARGDLLYVAETDKIANEVVAERAGTLEAILVAQGETVPVGTPLASWQGGDSLAVTTLTDPVVSADTPPLTSMQPSGVGPAGAVTEPPTEPPTEPAPSHSASSDGRIIATPHARKLARQQDVDLKTIIGSGPGGRIKARDIGTEAIVNDADSTPPSGGTMRAAIARRMTESKQQIPHFYLTANAEISELLWLHQGMKKTPGLEQLTLTHWIATAVGMALAGDRLFRTVFQQNQWLELPDADVGIAVAVDAGLYAPVARKLDRGLLGDNATQINRLIDQCRTGSPPAGSLQGGATTVSNLGNYPIEQMFPIINPGQSSILGVGRTQELFRPDDNGEPGLCRELPLVLACDHRVFNGTDGARFLEAILNYLQQPMLIVAKPRH